MRKLYVMAMLWPCLVPLVSLSQESLDQDIQKNWYAVLTTQSESWAEKMDENVKLRMLKFHQELKREEHSLLELIRKKDAQIAKQIESALMQEMEVWEGRMALPAASIEGISVKEYLPRLDSLSGLLSFLQGAEQGSFAGVASMQSPAGLVKNRMGLAAEYERWLMERQDQWMAQLRLQPWMDQSLNKAMSRWIGDVAYYKAQVSQWKALINDPTRLEAEALRWINKLPAFQEFMKRNGELAHLFGGFSANAGGSQPMVGGTQSREAMAQALQAQFGQGAQAGRRMQQQLQSAMGQLAEMQQNLTGIADQAGAGSQGNVTLTARDAERAAHKAKPTGKKVELGWNLQAGNRIRGFPAVTDLALSAGYRITPDMVLGAGLAYKFGLGSWEKIQWTHEGVGFRSFGDFRLASPRAKMFGDTWLTVSAEMNYFKRINDLSQFKELAWDPSLLAGFTKRLRAGKREGKIQILYDFSPRLTGSSPFLIRWGWNLR